jgi:hypothetical protein
MKILRTLFILTFLAFLIAIAAIGYHRRYLELEQDRDRWKRAVEVLKDTILPAGPAEYIVRTNLVTVTNRDGFNDGVKYGLLWHTRNPFEDRLEEIQKGASNLWQIIEMEKGTNTLSEAYRRVYPPVTFDEGIEYGVGLLTEAIRHNLTNVTLQDIKAAAYQRKVMSLETNAPSPIVNQRVSEPANSAVPVQGPKSKGASALAPSPKTGGRR